MSAMESSTSKLQKQTEMRQMWARPQHGGLPTERRNQIKMRQLPWKPQCGVTNLS